MAKIISGCDLGKKMKWMYKEEKPFGKTGLSPPRILVKTFLKIRNETGGGSKDQREAPGPRPCK